MAVDVSVPSPSSGWMSGLRGSTWQNLQPGASMCAIGRWTQCAGQSAYLPSSTALEALPYTCLWLLVALLAPSSSCMATYSSILPCRIPWTEDPGWL